MPMYDAPNAVEELAQSRKHPTVEKVEAKKDALKFFDIAINCNLCKLYIGCFFRIQKFRDKYLENNNY